ncbi:unnamed protein product [Dibothriocephalus latus]|uniref:Uncharacterized protein n=1 Tax=Dibothriocephalus latus TaxID=60516 RepID=A0A3P7LSD4_DIBLA|nr:unnamed protein product [Dibothriocephalus latus]
MQLYDAQAASAPYRYTRLSSEPSRGPSRSCGGSRKHSLSGLTPSEQEYQIKRCSSTGSSFKFYSLDGPASETNECGGGGDGTSFENLTGSEPDQGYNVNALCADRYHSELDFEFAHRKRWMRLLIATERAFAVIEAVLPTGVRMADCPILVLWLFIIVSFHGCGVYLGGFKLLEAS